MTTLIALTVLPLVGPGFELKFVPSGMTAKMGSYSPMRAEMTSESLLVKKPPSDLKMPMFGKLTFGDKTVAFILDEPEGSPAKLYVDSNGNGDLTDDPTTVWESKKQGASTMYNGSAQVSVEAGKVQIGCNEKNSLAKVNLYRFDPKDPQRAALAKTLLYYPDFGYQGKGTFGDKTYTVAFAGLPSAGARIWVDRNDDGKSNGRSENISAAKPFNFGGTTYSLRAVGNSFEVMESAEKVDEIPLPPDLSVGKDVLKFEALATDGTKISFPESYKGKIVMLDFWATWCGPCIAELPNLKKVYAKYHDQGFEVLGISFDQKDAAEKLANFTKDNAMPWRQIYEGKYWETKIGLQFGVEGIPFCLLVDGDTGKILATVRDLRGEAIDGTIGKALAARKAGG